MPSKWVSLCDAVSLVAGCPASYVWESMSYAESLHHHIVAIMRDGKHAIAPEDKQNAVLQFNKVAGINKE